MKRSLLALLVLALLVLAGVWLFKRQHVKDPNTLTLFGNVDVRQVNLGFRVAGRVLSMPYQEGDVVEEGALVGALEPEPYRDLVKQAEASLASVLANLANAENQLIRRGALQGEGGVSDEDFQTAEANRNILLAQKLEAEAALGVALTNLRDTHVWAPSQGTILTRVREPGSVVKEADPIYTLSLLSPVWIRAFVSEPDLGRIYPGQKALVITDSGKSYEGHIGFISPVAEFTPKTVETETLRVDLVYRLRVIADNPDHFLKQGMPVTVKLRYDPT